MVKKGGLPMYVLYVNAVGATIFYINDFDSAVKGIKSASVNVTEFNNFSKVCVMKSFFQFDSVDEANEVTTQMVNGELHPFFQTLLKAGLPKIDGKNSEFVLGVDIERLQYAIKKTLGIKVKCNEDVLEIVRGIQRHFLKFVPSVTEAQLNAAEISLAHASSRDKVRFNPKRDDTMVTQAISLLETYTKQSNVLGMRLREWAGWHFPELSRIITSPDEYASAVAVIKSRQLLESTGPDGAECRRQLNEIVSQDVFKEIMKASRSSMGVRLLPEDEKSLHELAVRAAEIEKSKKELTSYIGSRMNDIAPNLSTVVGSVTGAKLLLQAGSLASLSKLPASTVQVLGAQKALFRAMKKDKRKTPKYGVIFGVPAIGKTPTKYRGRLARCLAAKAVLAARIDFFREHPDSTVGKKLRKMVDQRIKFLGGKA